MKAAEQVLCEALGYDEARAYCLLLNKRDGELGKEFSYSKRYRLLKSLFELGAVGKIKPEEKDFFSYFLLPPSFLYFGTVDEEIINYLEKIYLDNFRNFFEQDFSQIILKNEKPLILFFLKYFMKESAKIFMDEIKFDSILGKDSDKVIFIRNHKETRRKIGVIDSNFAFEFTDILNKNGCDFIGYIAKNG